MFPGKKCPKLDSKSPHVQKVTVGDTYSYGDSVKFLCDICYVLTEDNTKNTKTITCQSDGTWSEAIPTCTGKQTRTHVNVKKCK